MMALCAFIFNPKIMNAIMCNILFILFSIK